MLEVSKDVLLDILGSLGVELPSDTSMTADVLQDRLEKAIDAAQSVPTSSKKKEIDINGLKKWSSNDGTVQFAVDRTSWQDCLNGVKSLMSGFRNIFDYSQPEGRDAFVAWRYLLNLLGQAYDAGRPGIIMVDDPTESAVLIKIHEVRMIDNRTPILIVHFRHSMDPTGKGLFDFGRDQRPRGDIQAHMFVRPAQYLVLMVLETNAKRIPSSYAPVDPGLTLSFLLPVGTIGASETGKLAKNNVCAVCTSEAKQRCSQCLAVYYCSRECQTQDWKTHKRTCNKLEGANWETFAIDTSGPFSHLARYPTRFSHRDPAGTYPTIQAKQGGKNPSKLPPMKKASADPFLLKIQDNNTPWLMIYDRSRELDAFLKRDEGDGTGKWSRLRSVMERKGTQVGLNFKVYCWAKRTGERELSVSLDRVPDQDVPW